MLFLKIQTEEISYSTKILTIQVKRRGLSDIRIWKCWKFSSEENLLQNFRDWFLKENDKIFVGYNILKFDLPLLLLKLSSMEKFDEFSLKLNHANILDLFVILTFLKKEIKGFEYYCQKYDIEVVSEEKILDFYNNGDYQKMEESIIKNLHASEKLYSKVLKEYV